MAGPRPASGLPTRKTGIRQPTRRTTSAAVEKTAAPSSKTSTPSKVRQRSPGEPTVATKKERNYEREVSADTSIHVVVRCRGRNEREVKENSGVAVSTEGVKGKTVEISMGPNAVSNKTYAFDKVFSPAASQEIVYEDVALPFVNEVFHLSLLQTQPNKTRCSPGSIVPYSHTDKQGLGKHIRCLAI